MEKKPWSEEEIKTLEQMISLGYTYREIANALERTPDSIKSFARRRFGKRIRLMRGHGASSQVPKGIIDMDQIEVMRILGISPEDLPNKEATPRQKKGQKKNARGYLSDAEALRVISEYLKKTKNIYGATKLWELHLLYRRKKEMEGR